jgi:hypothetical protein
MCELDHQLSVFFGGRAGMRRGSKYCYRFESLLLIPVYLSSTIELGCRVN